jgi:hypothetical protein
MRVLALFLRIDRRWIFLCIALAVFVPFVTGLKFLQGTPTPATVAVYDYIDRLPPGRPVMLIFDYGPAGMPEIHPMAMALIRHCFMRKVPIIAMTLYPQGPPMADLAFSKVVPDFDVRYGRDYVNLGFKPGGSAVILGIGSGFETTYPSDTRGTPLSQLPIMRDVKNYSDLGLAIDLATGSTPSAWIAFAHQRFRLPVALGITAVMATDNYVYLQTGQIVGLINGMRGAAEYEHLVEHPDVGSLGMSSQSVAHLVIILFVILGNIGYFAGRAHARRTGEV